MTEMFKVAGIKHEISQKVIKLLQDTPIASLIECVE